MQKIFRLTILLLCSVIISCSEDPFDELILVDHPYSDNANLANAINIKEIKIDGYSIHPFSKDTLSAKIVIMCDLDTNYFGVNLFQPKYDVTPELFVDNSEVEHKNDPTSGGYYAFINYPKLKNKKFEIVFKFNLVKDLEITNHRKIASNSVQFKFF